MNKTDKQVLEYLKRANAVFVKEYEPEDKFEIKPLIEIAKMIQLEEKK